MGWSQKILLIILKSNFLQARLICLLLNSKGSIFRSAKSLENLFAKNEIQALKTVDIFFRFVSFVCSKSNFETNESYSKGSYVFIQFIKSQKDKNI